jgi:hypothetical protein
MSTFIDNELIDENEAENEIKQSEVTNNEIIKNIDNDEYDELDLPEDLLKIAFEELGETKEIRKEKLIELRELINNLPDEEYKLEDTSDKNLIRFLRGLSLLLSFIYLSN